MRRKILYFLILAGGILSAQIYKPLDSADYAQRKAFLADFQQKNETLVKSMKDRYSGKTSATIGKFYTEYGKEFVKNVKNKDYLFGSVFDEATAKILAEIGKNNPSLNGNMKVLIAKDNTPNAFCYADGTFVINMGIFSWMDNEAQIAAILSHELAHKTREHTLKALLAEITDEKSDKELYENIKTEKLNKSEKAFDLLKNRRYKKGVLHRKSEVQADSLGFVYFRNLHYPKQEFVNALVNLKEYDTLSPTVLKTETYRELYNLPTQPFKDGWLKKEDFSLYNYNNFKEKLDKDSLSTHPELEKRIALLKSEFPELKTDKKAEAGSDNFKNLKKIARMEILPNFYHQEEYGAGIYTAMQFLQDGEEKEYYKMWLGKCFGKIYEARKNYTLNRYLDRVDPKNQSESYQQFLNFMWNLNLDEIKNIVDYYNKKTS